MKKGIELWMMIGGKEEDEEKSLDVRNGDGEEGKEGGRVGRREGRRYQWKEAWREV